jgi:hypothetical protein
MEQARRYRLFRGDELVLLGDRVGEMGDRERMGEPMAADMKVSIFFMK